MRRSSSSTRSRHSRSLPSAVRRSRPHLAQKGWLMGLMNPRVPAAPRIRYVRAGSSPERSRGSRGPKASSSRRTVSSVRTTLPSAKSATSPKGIISMNRTSHGRSRVSAASGTTASSLNPRTTTVLSLTGCRPASSAARIPSRTSCSRPPRVMRRNCSGSRVSRLTLTRRSPASASGRARSASSTPFVVSATSSMPGMAAMPRTSSTSPGRTVGSPPVSRTFWTPSSAAMRVSRRISWSCSSSAAGRKRMPSAGMQ
ncbi:hypothetical protein HRbin32_01405 [bacterium HR32]|nr:hypothetical protein HRbin32_01405 [bacterium HR32]